MKIITYSDTSNHHLQTILKSAAVSYGTQILAFRDVDGFTEAIRINIAPRPVIVFSASDQSAFRHLSKIRQYIADTIFFLMVPDETHFQIFQEQVSIYPRYVFYQEDDQRLLLAILNKLLKKKNHNANFSQPGQTGYPVTII